MRRQMITLTAAFVLLAGTASAQEWTDWQPITPEQSAVSFEQVDTAVDVQQVASHHSGKTASRELWQWDTGRLYLVKLSRGYFRARDKGDFAEAMSGWDALKELGITATKQDVKRGVNNMGKYFYAELASPNANVVCFVFMQNMRYTVPAGYEAAGGLNAGGFVDGFDCQDSTQISAEEHEMAMKQIVATFRRQ